MLIAPYTPPPVFLNFYVHRILALVLNRFNATRIFFLLSQEFHSDNDRQSCWVQLKGEGESVTLLLYPCSTMMIFPPGILETELDRQLGCLVPMTRRRPELVGHWNQTKQLVTRLILGHWVRSLHYTEDTTSANVPILPPFINIIVCNSYMWEHA